MRRDGIDRIGQYAAQVVSQRLQQQQRLGAMVTREFQPNLRGNLGRHHGPKADRVFLALSRRTSQQECGRVPLFRMK